MQIRFENNDEDEIICHIKGEINTASAKILETKLENNISMTDHLVLDFAEVPFLSSAGLRILMKMDDSLKNFGSLKLINVNDQVYDIFKMVKFTDILTIEGRESAEDAEDTETALNEAEEETCIEKKTILTYTKKQIMASALMGKIEKLRTMFDKIKIYGELDLSDQMKAETMMEGVESEEIDPLYARFFVSDGEIQGLLNAQELAENEIRISTVMVEPGKDASTAMVLMLASLLDAVCTLLEDEDRIHVVVAKEKQVNSYLKLLGEPEQRQ